MRHGSLFSGIGGFDLAADWMGWENVFHCEWNEFGQRVLKYHFPKSISYNDITKTDFTIHRGQIDILTGGFPCQPYSTAGKRLGKADDRHLWPEMLRAIREIQPTWVVGENVRGLTNWNGGVVFDEVQADLEAEGYEVTPFLLPACAVNAPHRRDRIWFVAKNTIRDGRLRGELIEKGAEVRQQWDARAGGGDGVYLRKGVVADTEGVKNIRRGQGRFYSEPSRFDAKRDASDAENTGQPPRIDRQREKQLRRGDGAMGERQWDRFPTESPIHRRDDGLPQKLGIFVVKELYDAISKTSQENRIENLQEVRTIIQSPEIWEQIRGLYSLESKEILLQTMQLYSAGSTRSVELSPFCQEVSKEPLRTLRKYGEFRSSPQGQELEKQRSEKFGNTLSFLPHEVALAARAFTASIRKFEAWHRSESIKAYGNAIVPQVALQIFKAISQYENN